jgi:hypothetical protein
MHIGLYCNVNAINATATEMGVVDGSGNATVVRTRITGNFLRTQTQNNFNLFGQFSNSDSTGVFLVQRTTSTLSEAFRNGVSLGTVATVSTALANIPYLILSYHNVFTPAGYSNRPYQFFTMGDSFTLTEISDYTTAITNFQTTLGRA